MKINNKNFTFLSIGKTQESKETAGFKRYIGVGSSYVVAVNPTKKELDAITGYESANEPEYVVDTDNGKEARITFVVKTDSNACNGIEMVNRVMFTLRNAPAYNKDKLLSKNGNEMGIDTKYRMAYSGEVELIDFLKTYLCVGSAFNYVNGSWVKKDDADDFVFGLEHIKDYFTGDFSEIKEAIALQPNNKVKLLYGVRTTDDGKQYQAVATRSGMVLRNNAGSKALVKLEKELADAKDNGAYASTEFKVQELAEYDVKATDLNAAPASTDTSSDAVDDFWNN